MNEFVSVKAIVKKSEFLSCLTLYLLNLFVEYAFLEGYLRAFALKQEPDLLQCHGRGIEQTLLVQFF